MLTRLYRYITFALAAVLLAPTSTLAASVIFSDSGSDRASIQDTVDAFRSALGDLNPANEPVSFGDGRREINWDGVPDEFSAPNNFPPDFFNTNLPRGVVFSTLGSGFQVSTDSDNPTGTSVEFGNINPTYPDDFSTFSPQRFFTALDSNIIEVSFFIPGSNTPATTDGFGAVFTDVDLEDSTKIEYFDTNGSLLESAFAQSAAGDEGLSFLGTVFDNSVVSRVRITSGNAPLSLNNNDGGGVGPTTDVVAVDDLVYGEPVPEPSSVLGILLFGSFPLLHRLRRRGRKSAA